jgi:hypothetical protein
LDLSGDAQLSLTFKELPSSRTGVDEWRQKPDTAWYFSAKKEMKYISNSFPL